jgi:hypothetical protein
MIDQEQLVLVRADKSRGAGPWSYDDFDVRLGDANGLVVGKIFKAAMAPADLNWLWTITERTPRELAHRGYAATRQKAAEAFNRAWLNSTHANKKIANDPAK